MTADDYYNLADITRILSERYGYRFDYHDIPSFVEEMKPPVHAARSDLSAGRFPDPLGGQDRGDAGQAIWQHPVPARARAGQGPLREPALTETVDNLVRFLRSERLITEAEDEAQRSA